MNNQQHTKSCKFWLAWFAAESELPVGEEKLSVTEEQVADWFWFSPRESTHIGELIVMASQRRRLQEHVKHEIDLNKYDYYVEYAIDFSDLEYSSSEEATLDLTSRYSNKSSGEPT